VSKRKEKEETRKQTNHTSEIKLIMIVTECCINGWRIGFLEEVLLDNIRWWRGNEQRLVKNERKTEILEMSPENNKTTP
jgi:hypothetical protein